MGLSFCVRPACVAFLPRVGISRALAGRARMMTLSFLHLHVQNGRVRNAAETVSRCPLEATDVHVLLCSIGYAVASEQSRYCIGSTTGTCAS